MAGKENGLAGRIRAARKAAKKTQGALAAEVGTTQDRVSEWERGREEPSLRSLRAIAAALGTTAGELVG